MKQIGEKEAIKLLRDQGVHVTLTLHTGRVMGGFLLTGKSGKQFLIVKDGIHLFNEKYFISKGGKIVRRKLN